MLALREQANVHPQMAQFHQFIDSVAPVVHALPHGLIHGEINLANAARRSDGTLVLLDWDEAGDGSVILEAAYPLLVVFLTEALEFHHDLARAFYHQYYAGRTCTSEEQDLLFRAALFHALRYMLFANQQQRWERICFAVAHQDLVSSVLP
jgi:Ser/Thr protein kinase RdoA (MazF antagonist)